MCNRMKVVGYRVVVVLNLVSIVRHKDETQETESNFLHSGGEEIRTLDNLAVIPVFETSPFNRSGTPPWYCSTRTHAIIT